MKKKSNNKSFILKKHLTKIITYQIFFSLLFGVLAYMLFYSIGKNISAMSSLILALANPINLELSATILATAFSIFTIYLCIYTVGAHYGIYKKFFTILIGTSANIFIAIFCLVIFNQQLVYIILLFSFLIALFGFHHYPSVHPRLQKS